MERKTRKGEQDAYRRYVEGFLGSDDSVLKEAMDASGYAIGGQEFRDEMEDGLKGARSRKADTGDIVWPEGKTVGVEAVEKEVTREFGVTDEDLHLYGNSKGNAKMVAVELCCQLTGKTQRELAVHFGYKSESSIGKERKLLKVLSGKDERLMSRIGRLKRRLLGHTF